MDANLHPGRENLVLELSTLLEAFPPPFIYVYDPVSPSLTSAAVDSILTSISSARNVSCAHLDAVECFTARILYDSALNAFSDWHVDWESGCANWGSEESSRFNDSLDSFLNALSILELRPRTSMDTNMLFILTIDHADRLRDNLPDLLVPLTRLNEMSRLDICVVFISDTRWEDIKPPLGAALDPYYFDIPVPTKTEIVQHLSDNFLQQCDEYAQFESSVEARSTYNVDFSQLFADFASCLCDMILLYTCDPLEIQYIASARWPGFAKPLLDANRKPPDLNTDEMDIEIPLVPPEEDTRMRLIQLYKPTLSAALNALYPRNAFGSEWAETHKPGDNLLNVPYSQAQETLRTEAPESEGGFRLPRLSKFILLAAFLASTNPAKSDRRMFYRGLDEKKRKRKVTAKSTSVASKPSQRLQGPASFPLDRLIAILGALIEENTNEDQLETFPGEYTDNEIRRTSVYTSLAQLSLMSLVHRVTPVDRLDGPPQFKCNITIDLALSIARDLDVQLHDLLWDPM